MDTTDNLDAIAARIQAAWESGRICSLVGRGCRARIVRIGRLVTAGRLDPAAGLRLAIETEALAFCLAPLPPEPPTP
ncbi:hypothetical protein MPPM_1989 [Methylorubrum populi]|uniref:Uncharacterized protein n=1 Tax=Methylorubrum populi TaxID=223967 RepID=A0A160PDL8_9HYPH|nr:hypothetical protein [Methylorubrum populi]BAU90594.1 hypothetical protein MPPM_1989 [Methylorubrum populi]